MIEKPECKLGSLKRGDCFIFNDRPFIIKGTYWENSRLFKQQVFICRAKFADYDSFFSPYTDAYQISKGLYDLLIETNNEEEKTMIISHRERKARKECKCDLSGKKIAAGQAYMSVTQTYEGSIFAIKVHADAWSFVQDMEDICGNEIDELLDKGTYRDLLEVNSGNAEEENQCL